MGQKDDCQRQEAHTAQKMCLAPPEEQAVGKCFDVGEDGGTGCGIAGDHFKKGIGKWRYGTVKNKGQGREGGDNNPADNSYEKAIFNS